MSFTLYDYALSGNCYKIRLMASILGVEYERVAVEFYPAQDHKSEKMLQISPAGTLPILKAGDLVLSETSAMLLWLAQTFDKSGHWWVDQEAKDKARIFQWMGFAGQLTATIGQARLNAMLHIPVDRDKAISGGLSALRQIEAHLTEQRIDGSDFLVGDRPTIADIACFPYVALSPDVGLNLGLEHEDYPAIGHWLYAIKSLDGFIPMPGIFPMHELKEHEVDYGSAK